MKDALAADEAHLYLVEPDALRDASLLARLEALLSEPERARRARFRFPEGRHEYLVTHALLRTALSRYADVAPEAWTFSANAYGRPEISGPARVPAPRFNLSHTKGLVACVVSLGRDVGVDVEAVDRGGDLLEIAERFFSQTEARALRQAPAHLQRERFLEYWTLKESYIKARGMGLSLPLSQFSFDVAARPPRIAFGPEIQDDPDAWEFVLQRPTPGVCLAASLRKAPSTSVRLLRREALLDRCDVS